LDNASVNRRPLLKRHAKSLYGFEQTNHAGLNQVVHLDVARNATRESMGESPHKAGVAHD
jgi:hypothetical protein